MPPRLALPKFKELVLRDNAAMGLTPEALAAATPLILLPADRQVPVARRGSAFLGWARLYLGLRSASRQLRAGRWQIREDQVWLAELAPHAFEEVTRDLRGNPTIAMASVWVPVQRRRSSEGQADTLTFGPAPNPFFARLQWVSLDEEGTLPGLVHADFLADEVHLRLPTRAGLTNHGDPRLWRRFLWSSSGKTGP